MNTSLSEFDQLYNLHKGMSYCRFCFISVGKSVDAATHKKQQKHSIIQRRKDKDFFFFKSIPITSRDYWAYTEAAISINQRLCSSPIIVLFKTEHTFWISFNGLKEKGRNVTTASCLQNLCILAVQRTLGH